MFRPEVAIIRFTSKYLRVKLIQGGSNMSGTCAACLHTNQSRSYLNHLVYAPAHPHAAYIRLTRKYFEVNLTMATSGRNM
jgi:hypothetical protein